MNTDTELHLTRLATWLLTTIGKALAVSVLVGAAFGFLGAIADAVWIFGLGGLASPLAFAAVLYSSGAPLPYGADQHEDVPAG